MRLKIVHAFFIISVFVFNLLVLLHLSKLDMFDFFSTLHKVSNLFTVIVLSFNLLVLIILYIDYVNHKNKDNITNEKFIHDTHTLYTEIKEIKLLIKNHIINNISLREKLLNIVKALDFEHDYKTNSSFIVTAERIVNYIVSKYTKHKTDNIDLDYSAITSIEQDLKNIIYSSDIVVDITLIVNLARTLLADFSRKKTTFSDIDTKVEVVDYFTIFIEKMYKSFVESKNEGITKETAIKNYSEIKGNNNANLQGFSGKDINININK